jgi:CcmD family protein
MIALTVLNTGFQQSTTPDTSGYMIAGYVVIFVVMLVYIASLIIRQRNLEQDYETLEELQRSGSKSEETTADNPLEMMQK